MRQRLVTRGGKEVVALVAHAADAADVLPRLDGDDVAGHECLAAFRDEERRLGVTEADAVAGVVRETGAKAPGLEAAADGAVDVAAGDAGPQLLFADGHRLPAGVEQPALLVGRRAGADERVGEVAAI